MKFSMESDRAKLFVGGISRATSEETLTDYFGSYGVVLRSSISKDRLTNNPRGFGFVSFSDTSSADKALEDTHVILGRTVKLLCLFTWYYFNCSAAEKMQEKFTCTA